MSEKTEIPSNLLDWQTYLTWAERQPHGRFELVDGRVIAMAPERAAHVNAKMATWLALRNALRSTALTCQAFGDGIAVRVSESSVYQPDVVVNCGERLAPDTMFAPQPVIVVEVASPSTERFDAIKKFGDYFRLPSVRHYLMIDAEKRLLLHHSKDAEGRVQTAIQGSGPLTLDPPGLTIQVEDLFEA